MHRVLYLIVVLLAGVASATPASGHAVLVATDPPDGVLLTAAPETLTLTFNEPVEPTALRLIGLDGATTELADVDRAGLDIVIRPPELAEGTHVLNWHVVSGDGHPVAGVLLFSVGVVTGTGEAVVSSDPLLRPLIWAARLLLYLGLFVGVGGVFFAAWIAAPEQLPGRARAVLRSAMIAGLVAAPVAFSLQGADLIGGSVASGFSPESWAAALKSTYTATLIAAVFALVAGLVGLARSKPSHLLSGIAFLAVAVAFSLSGHASRAPPLALTWLIVFIHTGAVAFWVGSLVPLALLLRDPGRGAVAALSRFSAVIPHAIAPLVIAGAVLVVIQLDEVSDLWSTDYGRILAGKLAAVVALFVLAIVNRCRLTPAVRRKPAADAAALRRSILVETAIVIAVFALVAGWRFTPPPRSIVETVAVEAPPFFTHLHGTAMAADITVTPGGIGQVAVRVFLYDAELVPLTATELTVVFANTEAGIGRIERSAVVDPNGLWEAKGFVLPVAGTWTIELVARISTFDQRRLAGPVTIVDPRIVVLE